MWPMIWRLVIGPLYRRTGWARWCDAEVRAERRQWTPLSRQWDAFFLGAGCGPVRVVSTRFCKYNAALPCGHRSPRDADREGLALVRVAIGPLGVTTLTESMAAAARRRSVPRAI